MRREPLVGVRRLAWQVAWLSAALIAFEIALMRMLLVTGWHHLAFLVISIALLGFGASGTILALARRLLLRRPLGPLVALTLLTAVSMPVCAGLATRVPVEAAVVPALLGRQVTAWAVVWALLALPFLLGATATGLAIMAAGDRIPTVYAANLVGSGAGAVAVPVLMFVDQAALLPVILGPVAVVGVGGLFPRAKVRLTLFVAAALVMIGAWTIAVPPRLRLDPYKYGAYLEHLVEQGAVARRARWYGPRGTIESFGGAVLHDLPFLGLGATPPPLVVITRDGHWAGSVLDVDDADEAAVVDQTLMSFPYALAPARPRVALLGEVGGTGAWLALRHDATSVLWVQPDPAIPRMLRGTLAGEGGAVIDQPGVETVAAEPRHVVDRAHAAFDLVQVVRMEGSAAGSGGVGGLGQDHLITVEGIRACLDALTDEGILVVCRGIQSPPRDNVKLLATCIAALEGRPDPGRHLLVVRDYLAVCTMVKRTPWTSEQIEQARTSCRERQITPVWFDGIRPDELNHPDELPGPADAAGDWYHHAAVQLLSDDAPAFIDSWWFDIRPPTDDRPFFLDFCRLDSIGELRRTYGDLWLTRGELALLFVMAAAIAVSAAAGLFILLPLGLLPSTRRTHGRLATVVYFAAIGLGYLMLEMTSLALVTRLVGDPLVAAAVTIGGFLICSGLGSMAAQRLVAGRAAVAVGVIAALVIAGALHLVALDRLATAAGGLSATARILLAFTAIALPAFCMGFPMPIALVRLERSAASLVPWAWGVNGFASVLAAPLATAIGMMHGFTAAAIVALALYAVAAVVFARLPCNRL